MPASSDPLSPYAPIRTVGIPHAPFDGVLARDPAGGTVLLVDRDELEGWTGWNAPAGEHVFTPADVVRRADGHDVVLPVVTERLDRFLSRRAASAPLTEGERVTVAVSILRGLATVLEAVAEPAQWWLAEDGRPVLILGVGDADARRASVELLTLAADEADAPIGRALADVSAIAAQARRRAHLAQAEDTLFALADAEPLATDVLTPARTITARAGSEAEPAASDHAPWWANVASRFDGELSDSVTGLLRRVRRTRSAARGNRRLPLLVGAAVAAAILAGGLLWPDGGDAGAEPVASTVHTPLSSPPASDAATTPREVPPADAPPDVALARLLDSRRSCADDECRLAIWEEPARARHGGAIDVEPERRSITLVDDLGGLAVLRVQSTDAGAAAQLVTIVDSPNGWRVRDMFDVADPP